MKIRLISSDQLLYRQCREVLLGFRRRAWDFGIVPSRENGDAADLFLWDLPAEMAIPESVDFDADRQCIFLIARRHLNLLKRRTTLAGFNLVLKPVNPVLLRSLLEAAISRFEGRNLEGQIAEQMRLERDELLQHLLQANLRLQEYDQDRTNFLAHSVHDIRAPLASVQGYCSLLLDSQVGSLTDEQIEVLERMQRSIRRLARLTAAMFQISVGAQVQLQRRPAAKGGDVQQCVAQAVHEVKPALEAKNIQLRLEVSPPAGTLQIDEMQIEQVLANLLDNACRFTPRNGVIEILANPVFWDRRNPWMKEGGGEFSDRRRSSSRAHNAYRIEVRDSGPGVPAEELDRIFEEYASASAASDSSRAGLGLAICHRIADAHRGIVFAQSKGSGATFVFVLPYAEKAGWFDRPQLRAQLVSARAAS